MIRLSALASGEKPLRVLCLGAHCDDIEIGCGGTIIELSRRNPALEVFWAVFGSNPVREQEARAGAARFLDGVPKTTVRVGTHRDGFFPSEWVAIKEECEAIRREFEPDVVFTHFRDDRHQDHRILSDLAWNTFRDHFILEYEVMKYDGDLGSPNMFMQLSDDVAGEKVRAVMECYPSQHGKHWFMEETFTALMRLRAIECGGGAIYAEAFYSRKGIL
jgi:LmbE family N-acetylglucosaminyl deacetylase